MTIIPDENGSFREKIRSCPMAQGPSEVSIDTRRSSRARRIYDVRHSPEKDNRRGDCNTHNLGWTIGHRWLSRFKLVTRRFDPENVTFELP